MITRAVHMNTQSHYSLCLFFTTDYQWHYSWLVQYALNLELQLYMLQSHILCSESASCSPVIKPDSQHRLWPDVFRLIYWSLYRTGTQVWSHSSESEPWWWPQCELLANSIVQTVHTVYGRFPGGHFPGWDVSRKDFVNGRRPTV